MQVTVEIADEVAAKLPAAETISRQLLEAFAAEEYLAGRLSRRQVGLLLGLDRWEAEEFLTSRGAIRPYTEADHEMEKRGR